MKNVKGIRLNDGGYFKKILFFAVPVVLTQLLQSLYNMADILIISWFEGDLALAGVSCTGQLTGLMTALFLGLASGAGVCVAHAVGAKKYKDISDIAHTALLIAGIAGVAVAAVGLLFTDWLLSTFLDIPSDVMPYATTYVRIIFLGIPASLLYNYCASMLRATGDSKRPMIYLSLSGILNVILNIVLVAGFGMSVAGVAIGTIASQYMAFVLVMMRLGRDSQFSISWRKLRIHKSKLIKILKIGIPSGVQTSLFSFSNVSVAAAINSFGSTAMAGVAASGNIVGIIHATNTGFYEASLSFMGMAYGAKKYRDIMKIAGICVFEVLVISAVLSPLVWIFKDELLGIYLGDNVAAISAASAHLFCQGVMFATNCFMNIGSAMLKSMGRSTQSMIIVLIGACLLRIVWLQTVFELWWHTPLSIYITFPISWVLTAVVLFLVAVPMLKKEIRRNEGGENG